MKEENKSGLRAGATAGAATGAVAGGALAAKHLKNVANHREAMKVNAPQRQKWQSKVDKMKNMSGREGAEKDVFTKKVNEYTKKIKDATPTRDKLKKKHIAAAVAAPLAVGAGVGYGVKKYKEHKRKKEEMKKKASVNEFMNKYAAGAVSPDDQFWGVGLMSGPDQGHFDFLERIRARDGYDDRGGQLKKASLRP